MKIFEEKVNQNKATVVDKDLLMNMSIEFHKYLRYLRVEL